MECVIRRATPEDAAAISGVVIAALRESNARDYAAEIIAQVEQSFTEPDVRRLIGCRQVYVALAGLRIVATASLDGNVVRSVFVHPDYQALGIGRRLMSVLHAAAVEQGLPSLHVPSSVTAQGFYHTLGYEKIRDEFHGAERTVVMTKTFPAQ